MSMSKDQIKDAAMQLNAVEREALAEELLLSLSDNQREEIDAAWIQEVKRRDQAFLSGETSAKPVDEVISRIKGSSGR